jgi:very-short-patch-repair endonuclease
MALRLTEQEAHVLGLERRRGAALPCKVKRRKVSAKSEGEELLALHIKLDGLPEAEREYRFHNDRKWRFDFAYPALKFAIEVEGGTRSGNSRHTKHDGFSEDCVKYGEATILGWAVMRFTTQQVKQGIAIEMVKRLLMGRKDMIV